MLQSLFNKVPGLQAQCTPLNNLNKFTPFYLRGDKKLYNLNNNEKLCGDSLFNP